MTNTLQTLENGNYSAILRDTKCEIIVEDAATENRDVKFMFCGYTLTDKTILCDLICEKETEFTLEMDVFGLVFQQAFLFTDLQIYN